MRTDDLPDDVRVCNCGDCGRLLVTKEDYKKLTATKRQQIRTVYCRVRAGERLVPFCPECGKGRNPQIDTRPRTAKFDEGAEASPWAEIAIRAGEDGGD